MTDPKAMEDDGAGCLWLGRLIARALVAAVLASCGAGKGPSPVLGAAPSDSAAAASARAAAPAKPSLRRGMNLGNALDAPNEGDWRVVLSENDFVAYARAGFDHVRLPVRFSGHAGDNAPYTIDPRFFARVDWAIEQSLRNGLAVVVDLHHYKELMADPQGQRARFVGLWQQIAARYRAQPKNVYFELLNEPSGNLSSDVWNAILSETLAVVRASNPTRTVVLEGVFWASAKNLRDTLVVPEGDRNIVGSFHMYQPMLFTHQGAPWMSAEYQTTGVVFPGPPAAPLAPAPEAAMIGWVKRWFERYSREPAATNPSGAVAIVNELQMAQSWADTHNLPVYMGEFGANDKGDAASRAAWTRMTRTMAEKDGFGWAYWDDGASFKAYDRAKRDWVGYLKAALLD